jgi:signal transduction histidine kinase
MTASTAGHTPSTWYLPGERTCGGTLERQIDCATRNPVVSALLQTVTGAVAVCNAERQIVAVNGAFLDQLGLDDPEAALGLRPGEALSCVHAHDGPGGCGTARACASCGAAAAFVAAVARERPEERDCVLRVGTAGAERDLDLRVRACPFQADGHDFTLVSMVDVSAERRRAALERSFFHELSNLAAGLSAACQAVDDPDPAEASAARDDVRQLSVRLSREVQIQRALASATPGDLRVQLERVPCSRVIDQTRRLFQHHPASAGKRLAVELPSGDPVLETDGYLLHRIVTHMVANAFEATPAGGEVRLQVAQVDDQVVFRAWNAGAIPAAVEPRIFQRYFSTKHGDGRGQGTFMMKLFGERVLRGRVRFTSSGEGGTAFEIRLPRSLGEPPPPGARGGEPA